MLAVFLGEEADVDLAMEDHAQGDYTVLGVAGEIDVYTAPNLRERLVELMSAGQTRIVVDLSRVEFLDSTGLGVLVGAHKRARSAEGHLAVACSTERILKIFRITALDKVLDIHHTVDDAVATAPQ